MARKKRKEKEHPFEEFYNESSYEDEYELWIKDKEWSQS
jgi:hypothetical protein